MYPAIASFGKSDCVQHTSRRESCGELVTVQELSFRNTTIRMIAFLVLSGDSDSLPCFLEGTTCAGFRDSMRRDFSLHLGYV